jgi:hypothetical protein
VLAVVLATGAAPALAGCGREADLKPTTLIGRSSVATSVLLDPAVEKVMAPTFKRYVNGRKRGFRYGAGSPDEIASTVKNGRLIDLVILPAGPGLDRVENELLTPPTLLGTVGSTTYYLGAVTAKALPFVKWVPSPAGRATLRANGVR